MDAKHLIAEIANRFPTLRVTPDAWDVDGFMQRLGVASTGERHAMLFVANVWNQSYALDEGWQFDAVEALALWDDHHRAAFIAWANDPRWP